MSPWSRGLAAELGCLCELAVWWPKLTVHGGRVGNLCLWSGSDLTSDKMWLLGAHRLSVVFTVPYGIQVHSMESGWFGKLGPECFCHF